MSYEPTPAEPPAPAPTPSSGPTAKTWIIGGVGAVVIAAAAIIGINAASSDSGTVDTASTPGGNTANGGAAPGNANGQGQGPQGGFGGRGTFGTVESVDGSTLTIAGQDGTSVTVSTTDATTVTKSEESTVADLQVGDNVRVIGSGTSTEIAAQQVTDSNDVAATGGFGGRPGGQGGTPPEGMTPPDGAVGGYGGPGGGQGQGGFPGGGDMGFATGTIESIDETTMVVVSSDGTKSTVTLSADTSYTSTKQIAVADISKGDTISLRGETADGKVTAESISVGEMGFGGRGGFPGGQGQGQGGPGTGQSNGATGSGSGSN